MHLKIITWFKNLYKKRKNKIPVKVQYWLYEYDRLCQYGCLKINCQECKYLMHMNEYRYTCKRCELMPGLYPKYREEVRKIDAKYH